MLSAHRGVVSRPSPKERLRGGINIAICNKHHIRDRTSRKQTPADQLADQKQTALLIGDGHHDPDWHKKHPAHAEC